MTDRSTIREFHYAENSIWDEIQILAAENNFEIVDEEIRKKIYRKKVINNECWLIAQHNSIQTTLTAWIGGRTASFMRRRSSLNGIFEFAIKIPYKKELNKLLATFGERTL